MLDNSRIKDRIGIRQDESGTMGSESFPTIRFNPTVLVGSLKECWKERNWMFAKLQNTKLNLSEEDDTMSPNPYPFSCSRIREDN